MIVLLGLMMVFIFVAAFTAVLAGIISILPGILLLLIFPIVDILVFKLLFSRKKDKKK